MLKKALLYWDAVCWPQIQPVDFDMPIERYLGSNDLHEPELELLQREGVFIHMPVTVIPSRKGQVSPLTLESVIRQHIDIYMNLEEHEPGCWAIAEAADRFVIPSGFVPTADGALWALTDLLPAPALDVGHMEIVEFRRRHQQELRELRALIDECNSEIVRNPDSARMYGAALRRLDLAIANVWKALERERMRSVRTTLRVAITGIGAFAAEFVPGLLPLPRTETAAIAAVGAAMICGSEIIKELLIPNPTGLAGPSGYLYPYLSAAKESGIVVPPV